MNGRSMLTTFSDADTEGLALQMKVGILATVNDEGLPHLALLASLRAAAPAVLTFGQFTEGLSKEYIRRNPRTGFLVMSLQKDVWRGTAMFTHSAKSGPGHEAYNNQPLFRCNAYFGIHTVYFLDLVEHAGRQALRWVASSPRRSPLRRRGLPRALPGAARRSIRGRARS
jgi:hypothetical protein